MKSDIEIAQEAKPQDIREIAKKLGLTEDDLELYGKYKAKVGDISEKYLKYNIIDCKKRIDRLIKNGYNVLKISDYAKAMFDIARYDEVYTEYRSLQYLKKEII